MKKKKNKKLAQQQFSKAGRKSKSGTKTSSKKKTLQQAKTSPKPKTTKKLKITKAKDISKKTKKVTTAHQTKNKPLKTATKRPKLKTSIATKPVENPKSQSLKTAKQILTTKPSITTSQESKKMLALKKELSYLKNKKSAEHLIKDAKGRRYCHDAHCDQPAGTDIYCRYHYLALWPQIQKRKKLLKEDYLLKTIQQIIRMFGEKALNFILSDLKSKKSFESVLKEINPSLLKEEETLFHLEDNGF